MEKCACHFPAGVRIPMRKTILIMKLSVTFLFIALQVSAVNHAQKTINLKADAISLQDIFKHIEKQTQYRFYYSSDDLPVAQKFSVNIVNMGINQTLSKLLYGTTIKWEVIRNNKVILSLSEKPNLTVSKYKQITGIVRNEAGEAIASASVKIKGTTRGTVTDNDGAFTIEVLEGEVLEISAIGYAITEIIIGKNNNLIVTLKTETTVDAEVVVIGYGTQRKRDLTGSIASVRGEEIARMPNTNPISSLQGKVAGLTISNSGTPGAAPTVRVRGVNSTNSANPLYVVDGILQDNIDYLNPADIESVDILRDASSIAIYGLRGANGVIAITTKTAARGKTVINLQSSIGINKVINKIDVTDAEGFKKLYNAQVANSGVTPFDYTNYTANTDWQELILRTALLTNQSLSLSNSGEKTSTYFNLGYNKQEGVVKYGEYERVVARLKQELRVSKKFKVGAEISGTYWNTQPTNVSFNNALWSAPIVPVQAEDDLYYSMPSFQRAQVGNPIATMNRQRNTEVNRGYRFVGSLFAEWKITNDLTWKSTVYTDLGFNNNRNYTPLAYRFINLGEFGGNTDTVYNDRQFTSVSQRQEEFRRFQQDHTITWDKNFGAGHRLTAMGGFTTVYNDNSNVSGTRRDTTLNIPNDPDFWYLGIVNADNNPITNAGGGAKESIVGAFGRVSYAFRNKYLLNATIRRDGSSKFAPANRWGTFGSLGAGWVISDEDFFAGAQNINFLKLRAAWGKVGNSNGVRNRIFEPGLSNASTAIFGDNIYTAVRAAYIPDPNLKWEVVRSIDLGLDLRAFENRWNLELNFYDRTTSGILTSLEIPNDGRGYFTNLGKITNKGVELTTGWNDELENGIRYGIGANFSYNKNIVNSIGDKINFQIIGNGGVNLTETGQSIGYFYGYKQVGIYQTPTQIENLPYYNNALPGDIIYADIDGNDTVNTADRSYLGTPFPPYSFGASFNIGYKSFDLIVEGQGVAGNKIYTQRRNARFADLNYESNRLNAWTSPGTSNIEPILDKNRENNYVFSSYFLESGDYFRLRTLQLGYTFNTNILGDGPIKQARIYISGQNIKTWTRVTGYSPEAPIGSILGGGADNGIYPVPATYTFGVNLTF